MLAQWVGCYRYLSNACFCPDFWVIQRVIWLSALLWVVFLAVYRGERAAVHCSGPTVGHTAKFLSEFLVGQHHHVAQLKQSHESIPQTGSGKHSESKTELKRPNLHWEFKYALESWMLDYYIYKIWIFLSAHSLFIKMDVDFEFF